MKEAESELSRRNFLKTSAVGVVGATMMSSCAKAEVRPTKSADIAPSRSKLKALSRNAKQLWTVVYVDDDGDILGKVEKDITASLAGGADAAVLETRNVQILEKAVAHARQKFPEAVLGLNHLGDKKEPYGYVAGFHLSKLYNLQIVWVDFSGVDLIKELPEISLHKIEAARNKDAFYVSGIHMKYGTLLDPKKTIEQSALQAMGWVDGIIVTGPKTGVPTDPERIRRARGVIGDYPMGVASGTSAQNVHTIIDSMDYCLVNTSISDEKHRLIESKVRELRQVLNS
jgi:hypothetical protein